MDKLSVFGRTIGFHKAPFEIISRDPSSSMTKTIRLVCFVLPTRGPSTLSIYLFPIIYKILFAVFLLRVLLGWRTSSCGLIIRILAPLSLPLSFFTNSNMFPGTNHFGTGFCHYHVQKKIQIFIWKAMRNQLPTKKFLTFGHYHWDNHCPRCHTLEMTIHVLWDCPWAKEVWNQSLGILPLSFF